MPYRAVGTGEQGVIAHSSYFDSSVNPISTRWADYAHHITKVLFIYEYTRQNFRLRLLRLVDNCVVYLQDAKVVNESFAMCIHR